MISRLKNILIKISGSTPRQIIILLVFIALILTPNFLQFKSLRLDIKTINIFSNEIIFYYSFSILGFGLSFFSVLVLLKKQIIIIKKRKEAFEKNLKLQTCLKNDIESDIIDPAPYYSIEKVEIRHFKGIKDITIEIPPGTPWIFLTGENGFGKTSILQGIASSLDGYNDYFRNSIFNGTNLSSKLSNHNKPYGIYRNTNGKSLLNRRHQLDARFDHIYCYGSSRLDMYSESSSKKSEWAAKSLYDSQTLLDNIEHQLTRWYLKRNDSEFRLKYDYISNLFIELLNLHRIEIDTKKDKVIYFEKDVIGNAYEGVAVLQLAAGYRNIVSMVGDLILKVYENQSKIFNPKDFKGIVIIDEFELHLHPKYQKELPKLLSKNFPQIQFIVSTHSPIPLLGAPKNSVFLNVARTKEYGIQVERLNELENEIKDLLPNSILSSPLFGFTEIFPSQHTQGDKIRTETTYEAIKHRDNIKKELENREGTQTDELLKTFIRKRTNEKK